MASSFPHMTSTGLAPSAWEIYSTYHQAFVQQVSNGTRRPLTFPFDFLSLFSLIAFLCIPHKQNPVIYACRWPLVGLVTWFELYKMGKNSGTGPDLGALTGMISVNIIMLSWTWLIFNTPQWDAKRVEKRLVRVRVVKNMENAQLSEELSLTDEKRPEKLAVENFSQSKAEYHEKKTEYFWQPYPNKLGERIFWVLDLLFSSRGAGWNWAISTIPPLTPDLLSKLEIPASGDSDPSISFAEKKCSKTRCKHLLHELCVFISSYLAVDILATIMIYDPYFKFGPNTYTLPSYLQNLHPSILQFYRLLLTSVTISLGMTIFFSQNHIISAHILGPRVLGVRGEHWYYPRIWGDVSDILDRGLGGLWGSFWHQTYRNFFTAPTKYLLKKCYIKPRSFTAKIAGLFFAFGLSAFLHWAPSKTSSTSTRPFDQALFFLLQGVGIALQDLLCNIFSPFTKKLPVFIRQTSNVIYTLTWLYLTGSFAADDYARSGVWLMKPLPFSPMEALGLGEHNSYRHFMKSNGFLWYTGKHWWQSGVTLI
ncbi:hypothetical protein EV44_g4606 [Erysiphe necator]|uniref:Wax synthase domain-containing protein n=1 Tax=Uncinula necator TaxID=52586 RepID=A0A0B1P5T3_UNCNE|nr:hypothetical protein EV44_g4606 [Erysiphe necator]